MKKFKLIILLLPALVFNGCELTLEDDDFPYEPKLVIRSIIEENVLINDIFIGRTLPVAVPFKEDFAMLTDAVGAVVSDGVFYPLRYTGGGVYTTDSLIARRGKTYSLVVRWQDKSITAETTVPVPGTLHSFGIAAFEEEGTTVNVLEANVTPFANESYAATWVLVAFNGAILRESDTFGQVVRSNAGIPVKVRTDIIPPHILGSSQGSVGLRLYVYDPSFYDYFISQGSAQIPDAIFGQSSSNVRWNVKGDGIGMFIGRINLVSAP